MTRSTFSLCPGPPDFALTAACCAPLATGILPDPDTMPGDIGSRSDPSAPG